MKPCCGGARARRVRPASHRAAPGRPWRRAGRRRSTTNERADDEKGHGIDVGPDPAIDRHVGDGQGGSESAGVYTDELLPGAVSGVPGGTQERAGRAGVSGLDGEGLGSGVDAAAGSVTGVGGSASAGHERGFGPGRA
ncbi:MAG: hypothetical protein WC907_00975 [Acholeplasmataceae bacterium]